MQMKIFFAGFSAFAALLIPLPGTATAHAADGITTLEPVTVTGVAADRLSGKSYISPEQLEFLPRNDGSLNDLLLVLPGVQAGEMSNTSLQGGEILPPNLSISGGRFYENNFVIDGVGNNNLLDPAENDPEAINDLPGHPQELFLDTDLIDAVSVYRSNIPVEFGGFTGGVVDAETRMPGDVFAGQVDMRTTRSSWTRFHLDDEYEDEFDDSNSVTRQPSFRKYDVGVSLDLPLNEKIGMLTAYSHTYSKIPLDHFGETKTQRRELENYLIKLAHTPSERTTLVLTFIQAPYAEERFREISQGSEIRNSWYELDGNSYRLTAEGRHDFDLGVWELTGGYKYSENERNAPRDFYNWRTKPATWIGDWSKDWGTLSQSKEGGYGDLETSQKSEVFATSFAFDSVMTGPVAHEVKLGYGFERVTGTFERRETSYVYTVAPNGVGTNLVCLGDDACVDGEQFAGFRTVYASDSVNETINAHHAYLQDSLRFRRLTLRPGIRYATDNFQDNDDLDLRTAASLDLFGTGDTLLIGGVNRYHGRSLLAYKLAEAKLPNYTERRAKIAGTNTLGNWEPATISKSIRKYSELKTPYSDEWTVGVDQSVLGGRLSIEYIERKGKDEFASTISEKDEDGYVYTTLNNNGSSEHKEVFVNWERTWRRHFVSINSTWQETETSNGSYRDVLDGDDMLEFVSYHGELIRRIDLPRDDYNRGYIGNLIYRVALPYGFSFTNHTRYRSGFEALEDTDEEAEGPDGEPIAVYAKEKQPESWIFNWRLDWRRNLYRNHGLQLSLEVNNVFNQKVPAGAEEEIQTYELGRQFWAGMEYYF